MDETIKSLGTFKVTFANGVKVTVKRTKERSEEETRSFVRVIKAVLIAGEGEENAREIWQHPRAFIASGKKKKAPLLPPRLRTPAGSNAACLAPSPRRCAAFSPRDTSLPCPPAATSAGDMQPSA